MLYVYDKLNKTLEPCKETEFRTHGLLERQDLARWIESYPTILGEELLIITSEYDKFDKTNERLDLLAFDKDGNLVIIELKRDDSGKSADLQALKYAAYCSTLRLTDLIDMYMQYQRQKGIDSSSESAQQVLLDFIENDDFEELNDRPRIILVASEFRPEVTASVLFLRKFGIDISCVKWDRYELSGDRVAINSSVLIPLPESKDFVIQTEKKEFAEHTKTLSQAEYDKFYCHCIESLKKRLPREFGPPLSKSYYQISTGLSCVHYEWAFHGRPRSSFGVELHFEKGNHEYNQTLVKACIQVKDQLEKELGSNVIVMENWGKTWARLYVEKPEGEFTDELKDWAVDTMVKFIEILQPELNKIKKN